MIKYYIFDLYFLKSFRFYEIFVIAHFCYICFIAMWEDI